MANTTANWYKTVENRSNSIAKYKSHCKHKPERNVFFHTAKVEF